MRTTDTVAIKREDYTAPAYRVPETELSFNLEPKATRVSSRLRVVRQVGVDAATPLVLNGVDLTLVSVAIDGQSLATEALDKTDTHLTLKDLPAECTVEIVTQIAPDTNTSLEGLYRSSGNYCTQCEAEGFRKITYYPDRPDVLSVFTVRVEGDKASLPVLLSNGDPVASEELEDGRHSRTWHDPHPKPCYLFALVAGDLDVVESHFTTASGRDVLLQIFVQSHNVSLCDYAMGALKRSMAWDEQAYGLEYDLDRFMIVAVDDFNMGAMENKGLNLFNSKFVLASTETATDSDFIGVESVIAHEYFHNWTGNRVTCRDWFQLSLKEGLTVYRDQCFTADLHSAAVKRIDDVRLLRNHQFAEDASPMSHPIRPDSYVEINNFYTLTVYEKGAEVIRMFHTLLGDAHYRAGIDLYFQRHDGAAVTCDDFIDAMQDASGVDLTQFRRWYSQAGTPQVRVDERFDTSSGVYSLTLSQHNADTPGQSDKAPLHIPVDVALIKADGKPCLLTPTVSDEALKPTPGGGTLLELTERTRTWSFKGFGEKPVLSVLRQFSAPVEVHCDYPAEELAFLMASDTDTFNRWEAAQRLAVLVVEELEEGREKGCETEGSASLPVYLAALQSVIDDRRLDDALKAQMITPPSFDALAQSRELVDVHSILGARKRLRCVVAEHVEPGLLQLLDAEATGSGDSPDVLSDQAMASRALANAALQALSVLPVKRWQSIALSRYEHCLTMTDRMGALSVICTQPGAERDRCLQHFHDTFVDHKLVIDKWFMLQALFDYEGAIDDIKTLTDHSSFDAQNPNRLRSVYGTFASANPGQFHQADAKGYRWLADAVIDTDRRNPQVAARLVSPLTRWKRFTERYAKDMRVELQRVADATPLSSDVFELVDKSLG